MGLLDVVRSGIKTANTVTKDLQATVAYHRYLSDDGFGSETYADPVNLKAIVDWKQKQVRTKAGVLSVSRASVMFLDVAALLVAAPAGIDDNDMIVLPDGTTGPILDLAGFIDAGTGEPVATEVFLG